jgi:hypothetical protein
MKIDMAGALRDAWAMWRTDGDLLVRIAALFLFLPQFATLLLLPPIPPMVVTAEMSQAAQMALAESIVAWISAYGGWYLVGALIVQAGTLIVLTAYLGRDRPNLGGAIRGAAQLFPRYLLAMILVGLPLGLGVLTLVLLLPGLYVLGRMIALGPILVAERPISVGRAVARSWAMTRGFGLPLAGLVSLTILGGALMAAPFTMIDKGLRAAAPNVVAITLADAAGAAVAAAALLATALVQIAVYRRLVSSGT